MRKVLMVLAAVASTFGLVLVGTATSGATTTGIAAKATVWKTATSVKAGGGMAALVKAAEKEGRLNVITLPPTWANYGTIIKDFSKKYHIKITSDNPTGSSQDEINAAKQLKGQARDPDVFDMGTPFAIKAAATHLLAPYKVAEWSVIPSSAKTAKGDWYADYGGYVAIGYNSATVKHPPTSFASLLKPTYKNEVGINGNPTEAGAAFAAVYAAALANGGSFSNIKPGITYFKKLYSAGNFVPTTASESTVESGQTPIVIWWDYLQASEIGSKIKTWKVIIPSDGHYAAYYDQAINKTAPDPAAARLWEEYLYSTVGQNQWLQGYARPIELQYMIAHHTATTKALAALPKAPSGTPTFPSQAQTTAAEKVVAEEWASVTS